MRVSSASPVWLDLLGQYGQVCLLSKAGPADLVRLTGMALSAGLVWLTPVPRDEHLAQFCSYSGAILSDCNENVSRPVFTSSWRILPLLSVLGLNATAAYVPGAERGLGAACASRVRAWDLDIIPLCYQGKLKD